MGEEVPNRSSGDQPRRTPARNGCELNRDGAQEKERCADLLFVLLI